jgi:hypothetical protein
MNNMKIVERSMLFLAVLLLTVSSARGGRVAFQENVTGVATDDTLQNVLPEINKEYADFGWLLSGLVDGGSRNTVSLIGQGKPGNGVRFYASNGPIRVTWDMGEGRSTDKIQLDSLSIWLYAGDGRNFSGQLATSKDGRIFKPIPGTLVKKEFPVGKELTGLMHRIGFTFSPGEVTDFRFLRLDIFGFPGQICQIQEVDAVIMGATPKKYTDIQTTVRPVEKMTASAFPDQTQTSPMRVHSVKFDGDKLVLGENGNGKVLLNLQRVVLINDQAWKPAEHKTSGGEIVSVMKRSDGLTRTCRAVIDAGQRINLQVTIELPATAAGAVGYQATSLPFAEGNVLFDGVTYGSGCGPIFIPRKQSTTADIGERTPYLIFPCKKLGLELQFYMPDWFGTMGKMTAFTEKNLVTWNLFAAVKNFGVKNVFAEEPFDGKGKWVEAPAQIRPGQRLSYRINLGVFSITAGSLGQQDIETTGMFNPLIGIEAGTGNQQVSGTPRTLQRDKMIFMGFMLPVSAKVKPGHQLQIEPTSDPTPLLDRFAKSGFGILTLMADYRDVSHGVSYKGKYDQSPPGYLELLKNISVRGMKPIGWFSPRGFLQSDWGVIPKDRIVEEHPDWFTKGSHWFGMYRSVNVHNPAPSEWANNKMKEDLTRYPQLSGFAYDTFPAGGLQIDKTLNITAAQIEMGWLKTFTETIRSFGPDKVVLSNGGPPAYDEYFYYDYTVSEHPLLMFVNDVVAGKMPFGHTFVPWEQFGQLYFWYTPLGHMYYNFCDYDQGVAWVGPSWIGLEPGQMSKDFDKEVAPIWNIMGKGHRIYGAQIAPLVRQIEAKLPNGQTVLIVCSLSTKSADLQVRPQKIAPGSYRVTATVDTALNHLDILPFDITHAGQAGFQIKKLPPYSMMIFHFSQP